MNNDTEPRTGELQRADNLPARRPRKTALAAGGSPLDHIAQLLRSGITAEQLNQFLDVQQRWEREQARRDYVQAMAAFKAELKGVKITKKKRVKFKLKDRQTGAEKGEMSYKHETLAQVVQAVIGPMAAHGLSHSWTVKQGQDRVITVGCVVAHENGHVSDPVELFGLPDDSGQKNSLQQVRSTITYLQRATLLLITGLAAEDDFDDDGRGGADTDAPEQHDGVKASARQIALIKRRANSEEALAKALAKVGAKNIEELPFNKVNAVLAELQT